MTTPWSRVKAGAGLPADYALLAEARAEGQHDLNRLIEQFEQNVLQHGEEHGEAVAVASLVYTLADDPRWSGGLPGMLAEAVAAIVKMGRELT